MMAVSDQQDQQTASITSDGQAARRSRSDPTTSRITASINTDSSSSSSSSFQQNPITSSAEDPSRVVHSSRGSHSAFGINRTSPLKPAFADSGFFPSPSAHQRIHQHNLQHQHIHSHQQDNAGLQVPLFLQRASDAASSAFIDSPIHYTDTQIQSHALSRPTTPLQSTASSQHRHIKRHSLDNNADIAAIFAVPAIPISRHSSATSSFAVPTIPNISHSWSSANYLNDDLIDVPKQQQTPVSKSKYSQIQDTSFDSPMHFNPLLPMDGLHGSRHSLPGVSSSELTQKPTFLTPQPKLVRPVASAFSSVGLVSKKSRPRTSSAQPMPETPSKKFGAAATLEMQPISVAITAAITAATTSSSSSSTSTSTVTLMGPPSSATLMSFKVPHTPTRNPPTLPRPAHTPTPTVVTPHTLHPRATIFEEFSSPSLSAALAPTTTSATVSSTLELDHPKKHHRVPLSESPLKNIKKAHSDSAGVRKDSAAVAVAVVQDDDDEDEDGGIPLQLPWNSGLLRRESIGEAELKWSENSGGGVGGRKGVPGFLNVASTRRRPRCTSSPVFNTPFSPTSASSILLEKQPVAVTAVTAMAMSGHPFDLRCSAVALPPPPKFVLTSASTPVKPHISPQPVPFSLPPFSSSTVVGVSGIGSCDEDVDCTMQSQSTSMDCDDVYADRVDTEPVITATAKESASIGSTPSSSNAAIVVGIPLQYQTYTLYPRFLTAYYVDKVLSGVKLDDGDIESSASLGDYLDTNYKVLGSLGSGAFASVARVQRKDDGSGVGGGFFAVKKAKHPTTGLKDRMSKLEEVQIMWKLRDEPHCVRLENAWEQYGHIFLLMELCERGSLQDYVEELSRNNQKLDEFRIWNVINDLSKGLKCMHGLDIIHLDLKPSNILISSSGSLKIGDFGLAAKLPISPEFEREGDRTYIAPEILESLYGKTCDIFSLGLIILEVTVNIDLPQNGPHWHKLREGDFSECVFGDASPPLIDMIKAMLDPSPASRPTVEDILRHPFISAL